MAELADAMDLGSIDIYRAGSSPTAGTISIILKGENKMECKTPSIEHLYNAARISEGLDPVTAPTMCAPPSQKASLREIVQATDDTLITIEGVLDGIMSFMFGMSAEEIKENPVADMEDALVRNHSVANRIREKIYILSDRIGR